MCDEKEKQNTFMLWPTSCLFSHLVGEQHVLKQQKNRMACTPDRASKMMCYLLNTGLCRDPISLKRLVHKYLKMK